MKKIILSLLAFAAIVTTQAADKVESVSSPDGKIKVEHC